MLPGYKLMKLVRIALVSTKSFFLSSKFFSSCWVHWRRLRSPNSYSACIAPSLGWNFSCNSFSFSALVCSSATSVVWASRILSRRGSERPPAGAIYSSARNSPGREDRALRTRPTLSGGRVLCLILRAYQRAGLTYSSSQVG